MDDGFSSFPRLHARWLRDIVADPPPQESLAECANCGMCAPPGVQAGPEHFDPTLKCCTYLPRLANFLVGGVLADTSEAGRHGRASVRARIAARDGVGPLGLDQTNVFKALYGGEAPFGRAAELRCPHYVVESGGCGIWRHREATCTTWFCKHERGAAGHRFWRAVQDLLTTVERTLALHALTELGLPTAQLWQLHPARQGRGRATPSYEGRWGAWLGDEEALYLRCAAIVEPLTWSDVRRIAGPDVAVLAEVVRDQFARLQEAPEHSALEPGPFLVARLDGETARLRTYSDYDPIDVPMALLGLLHHFSGRTPAEALDHINATEGIEVEPALVDRLVDYELLVPVGRDPADAV